MRGQADPQVKGHMCQRIFPGHRSRESKGRSLAEAVAGLFPHDKHGIMYQMALAIKRGLHYSTAIKRGLQK